MMGYQVKRLFLRYAAPHLQSDHRGASRLRRSVRRFLYGYSHIQKYCVPFSVCMTCPVQGVKYRFRFLPSSVLHIQFSRYNAAQGRRKFLLISITFPLPCAAAAVSVPPALPAGYGQPAAVNCPVRFSALPVPSYLSSCLFHWPLPLLPASHSPPTGH